MTPHSLRGCDSHGLLLIILIAFVSGPATINASPSWTTQGSDVRELNAGTPLERELAGGEIHTYRFALIADQYLQLDVEQKGIDVVVSLFGTDGQPITEVDSPEGAEGTERVSAIASAVGEYRLEVKALDKKAKAGRYQVVLKQPRPSSPEDRVRIAAERVVAEADHLRAQDTAESQRKAIEKYLEALPLWRAANDPREALTLYRIGVVSGQVGDNEKALKYYEQSLPLWRALGDRPAEVRSLQGLSVSYSQLGEYQKALDYSSQTLPLLRAAGDRQIQVSVTLSAMGLAYSQLGKLRESLDYYTQALAIAREFGDRSQEANSLNNVGVAHRRLGDSQQALDCFKQALATSRAIGERRRESTTLTNLGAFHQSLAQLDEALEYYNQALPLQRAIGDRRGEAVTLGQIGESYSLLNQPQKALAYFNQALLLQRTIRDRRGEAITLRRLGKIYSGLGESQKALEYYNQALALQRTIGDRSGEALTLSLLGENYALSHKPETGLGFLEQALSLHRTVGDPSAESKTLGRLSRVERDLGRLDDARKHAEAALNIIESQRSRVISQDLRTSFSASRQDYYDSYIDLLMQIHKGQPGVGHDAAAFETSERARARSLVEILVEAHADIRRGIDPARLSRQASLQQELRAKAEQLNRLQSVKHSEDQERVVKKDLETLLANYEDVEAEIRSNNPRYAALTQPRPLSLKEIQEQVLDGDTLLLEYALGSERSYLWAVTPDEIISYELPKRAEVEAEARRVYKIFTARNELVRFEKPEQKKARVTRADAEYFSAAERLSQMILGPVAGQLGKKRLLIVSEGALQYVPFAALPEPKDEGGRMKAEVSKRSHRSSLILQPLIVNHEIVSLPSASLLAVIRNEMADRPRGAKTIAVLADPVFQLDDPRVERPRTKLNEASNDSTNPKTETRGTVTDIDRSARDVGEAEFHRLPYSRREAQAIAALTSRLMRKESLDFEANRATANSDDLSNYRIVHFATHGLVNNVHPELSGIVLSLVDREGKPTDGFLRLHEIYNLKLGAELVVLSACRTAMGKDIKGEGLIGLTRGFMYAGAPRVIATLWGVDDETTADLMKRFYGEMLTKKQRPAAALRAAQVKFWRERGLPPYFWAAFVIQGDWR